MSHCTMDQSRRPTVNIVKSYAVALAHGPQATAPRNRLREGVLQVKLAVEIGPRPWPRRYAP